MSLGHDQWSMTRDARQRLGGVIEPCSDDDGSALSDRLFRKKKERTNWIEVTLV